ncbi:MAG: hypothetical protein OJF59_001093 [Cytophagales bacterium]|nr:MAG: hypothetical protein OJF59_001093 [Cytophagales bacterium]
MFFRATEKSLGSRPVLYIGKEVIERMQGHITVKSKPGEGSEIILTIPGTERLQEASS